MLRLLNRRLRRLCSRLRWPSRPRNKPKFPVKRLGKQITKTPLPSKPTITKIPLPAGEKMTKTPLPAGTAPGDAITKIPLIRVATFNAAMFSMAPAVAPAPENLAGAGAKPPESKFPAKPCLLDRPKGILKQSPIHPSSTRREQFAKSRLRVSINLPDNEISLRRSRRRSSAGAGEENLKSPPPVAVGAKMGFLSPEMGSFRRGATVVEVLREVGADVIAMQDVRAEEERAMRPLSELAGALGMSYVFAESWAPEYGNAILSRWPIRRWRVQKVFDDSDFRNVLKATIDVPHIGEVNFHCTHLDHLDENWRMKQIQAIINSSDGPHILAGGLNSLDESDYSPERWTDIVKYHEETGKPTPKVEVMKFLKGKQYTDAKDFAGECESVVMIAKGQSVQGTCKYGTRVDYILSSPSSPYKFVPGSYSVFSSKGTSDHHIVKVDLVKVVKTANDDSRRQKQREQQKKKVVKIVASPHPKGVWKIHT